MEKPDLLILSDHYLTFVKDQVESLSPAFNRITVIVRYHPVTAIAKYVPIRQLRSFRHEALVDLTSLPSNVTVIPVAHFFLPSDRAKALSTGWLFRSVDRIISSRKISFDIIHAHFLWPMGSIGVLLKEKYHVPLIVTGHGYDVYDLPFRSPLWREIIGSVLRASDRVLTVSQSNLKCIGEIAPEVVAELIPNGFREDLFYPMDQQACRETLGLPASPTKIILTAGNLVPVKGHSFLVEAISEVVKGRSDLLCIIIGTGELRESLLNLIKGKRLEKRIILVGGQPHEQIGVWMNACDLFVLPSLRESFGIVQLEAMACGKPVIATINGGSEEIVIPNQTGLLCPPGDSLALALSIIDGFNSVWEKEVISKSVKSLSWGQVSSKILALYHSL